MAIQLCSHGISGEDLKRPYGLFIEFARSTTGPISRGGLFAWIKSKCCWGQVAAEEADRILRAGDWDVWGVAGGAGEDCC